MNELDARSRCMASTARARSGLSLAELLIATAVVALIMTAMATVAHGVRSSQEVCDASGTAVQHARVVLQRISHAIETATANSSFPGFIVLADAAGGYLFPETLVVWSPVTAAQNPQGMPLVSELVIFAPNPAQPNELLEVRWPSNTAAAPALSEAASWRTLIDTALAGPQSARVALTDRLRVAEIPQRVTAQRPSALSGAVWFRGVLAPSAQQWAQLQAGTIGWEDLDFVQSIQNEATGLRQHACQIELQLSPGDTDQADAALPFFASAVTHFQVSRP